MQLFLQREPSTNASTPGKLYVDGVFLCYTLEDVIREKYYPGGGQMIPVAEWKVPNETAIPSGRYAVNLDWSNRFKRVMPHIIGVPGFTGVRIHSGNTAHDTEGCILLGLVRNSLDRILESRAAFAKLFPLLEAASAQAQEVFIKIENPLPEPEVTVT